MTAISDTYYIRVNYRAKIYNVKNSKIYSILENLKLKF